MRAWIAIGLAVLALAGCASQASRSASSNATSPQDRLRSDISKVLGRGNRSSVPRLSEVTVSDDITVGWAIADNLTEGLTKDSSRMETKEILEAVQRAGIPYGLLTLVGSFELVDRYGNTSEEVVIRATYTKTVVDRINFAGLNFKTVLDLAQGAFVHPTFQY